MVSEHSRVALASVADKKAIETVLANHSRGIDRRNEPQLKSVYHPGGVVAYGFFDGTAEDFCRIVVSSMEGAPMTLHRSHKPLIELACDQAKSETYVIAYAEAPGATSGTQMIIGGRYLDRLEKSDGRWGVLHRTYVLDWSVNQPSTVNWTNDMYRAMQKGAVGPADPGNAVLNGWLGQSAALTPGGRGMISDAEIELLISKQALQEIGAIYCRAVDRADPELLKSIYHPDATVNYGVFNGSGHDFADTLPQMSTQLKRSFHSVANQWFDIRGDRAVGETYVIAMATSQPDGEERDGLVGGRYIDRYERRDGIWKISHRTFVLDWNINQPSTAQWDGPMYGNMKTRGAWGKQDPVYAFWHD